MVQRVSTVYQGTIEVSNKAQRPSKARSAKWSTEFGK